MMNQSTSRHRTKRIGGTAHLALAAASCLVVLALAPAAQAAPPVTFAEFGERGGQLDNPTGVAVDQSSGAFYVSESNNRRVSKFDADGDFLLAWGAGVADGTSPTLQTCGPQANPPTARCFPGAPFGTSSLTFFPSSVAVDQSSGDVYAAAGDRVFKFTSQGEFLLMFGKNVNETPGTPTPDLCTAADLEAPGSVCGKGETGSGSGEFFTEARSVVVEPGGNVWVGDTGRLIQFDSSGHYISEATVSGAATDSFARDSTGDFYAINPGADEQQRVTFSGAALGDTYRLGNLPAGCSSASTDPVEHVFGFAEDGPLLQALDSKCGGGNLRPSGFLSGGSPFEIGLEGVGKFAAQDLDQVTCEVLSGTGSCSVSTPRNGAPGEVLKFEASGSPVDTLTSLGTVYSGSPRTLTLDAADNLYVGDSIAPYVFKVFNPAGEQISQFGAGQVLGSPGGGSGERGGNGIAIGESAESLYSVAGVTTSSIGQIFDRPEPGPLPGNERAEDVLPTTATLAATLNPEGDPTTYFFEYGTDESYGSTTPVTGLPGSGFADEAVQAHIDHLIPETTYHFRLVASNHCNPSEPAQECTVEGEDATFTTPPAVLIEAQWASGVTSRSAVLHAEMNPLGVEAEAWIEYGDDGTYAQTVPLANLGDGFAPVARQAVVGNLTPGTTYHYRFVARDERDGVQYTVHGADRTLATQVAGLGFELADGRAWEMVSPPDKHGAKILGSALGIVQASRAGDGLAYLSYLSTEADPEANRTLEPSSTLARRVGVGSWSSKDLVVPGDRALGIAIGNGSEYKLFSPDLARAMLEPRTHLPLSPAASERTPYLRENTDPPAYTPLVTDKEGFANVAPGTGFGGEEFSPLSQVHLAGANEELEQVVVESQAPLTPGAPNGTIYLWDAGQLQPVSQLPATEGGAIVPGLLGSDRASLEGAIADDGSRVFWSTGNYDNGSNNLTGLYMRDGLAEETVRLDVVQAGASGEGPARPVFQGASADGTAVFFTDSRQLTADASSEGRDLYRCEIPEGAEAVGCSTLTDISAPEGFGESAEVEGIAAGLSKNAESIYFVARGVLDSAPNQHGESAVAGGRNLYVWRRGAGVRFIAGLDAEDRGVWGVQGSTNAFAVTRSAAASPSGRFLAFMSQRSLTGYDSREEASGEPLQEVFRYDALTERLECVSCDPSGALPTGETVGETSLVDPIGQWQMPLAAALPAANQALGTGKPGIYRPRGVLDNGRVFFNAFDALVAADSNGEWDVYQHEPTGVGDCSAASGDADTSRSAGGCVSLLSSGTGEEESAFLDASESGDDVFFLTPAQLSVTDEDKELDIYDARVNGVPARRSPNAECLGEACQPAAHAPNDPTPASAAFRGAGDPKPQSSRKRCAKGKRQVRRNGKARCVRRTSKRDRRKASKTRRAHR
jgi:hypothetical protein